MKQQGQRGRGPMLSIIAVSIIVIVGLVLFFQWSKREEPKEAVSPINQPSAEEGGTSLSEVVSSTRLGSFFIQNQGQAPGEIVFYAKQGNGGVYFLKDRLLFENIYPVPSEDGKSKKERRVTYYMRFLGASPQGVLSGREPSETEVNYFSGESANTDIATFQKLMYTNIYPNIDIEFFFTEKGIKYNIFVRPGGDPNQLQFEFFGLASLSLDEKTGGLILETGADSFLHEPPRSYQDIGGERFSVSSRYAVDTAKQIISFDVGSYDTDELLVIDPVLATLSASTYLGSSNLDNIYQIVQDDSGNIYVAGDVDGAGFPAVGSPDDSIYNGSTDVFVSQLSSNLQSLLISTYLGGTNLDSPFGLQIDSSGNILIGVNTNSSDFPILNGYDGVFNDAGANLDIAVVKMPANLQSITASTFVGGASVDLATGMALDSLDTVYVGGWTWSNNFPTTLGAYNTTPLADGETNGIVFALSSNLFSLSYATFIRGATVGATIAEIAINSSNQLYIVGSTADSTYPGTVGTYDPDPPDGPSKNFISRLSLELSNIPLSTFFPAAMTVNGMTIDADGNIFLAGQVRGGGLAETAGTAFPSAAGGIYEGFVSKFSSGLTTLVSTYLGSSDAGLAPTEYAQSIDTDASGNVYVAGVTDGNDFPTTAGAYDTFNGGPDVFLSKLTSDLGTLSGSTYLGGTMDDVPYAVLLGTSRIYVAGYTASADFPTSGAAYDTIYNLGGDGFISAFLNNTVPSASAITPTQATSNTASITTTVADVDLNVTNLAVEHSTDGSTWVSSTIRGGSQGGGEGDGIATTTGNISDIDTDTDGSVALTFEWNTAEDLPDRDDTTVYMRVVPNDGTENGSTVTSGAFAVDTQDPTVPSALSLANVASSSLQFTFPATPSSDTNFYEYKIYYATSSPSISDSAFASSTDANMSAVDFNGETTSDPLAGLTPNTPYYFDLYAYDSWGFNTSTAAEVTTTTLAAVPNALSGAVTASSITVSWSANGNPSGTSYYIQSPSNSAVNSGWITATSHTFSSLACGTSYSFYVKAKNSQGTETAWSTALNITTTSCEPGGPPPPVAPPPTPPQNSEGPSSEEQELFPDEEIFTPTGLIRIVDKKGKNARFTATRDVSLLVDATYADQVAFYESAGQPGDNFDAVNFEAISSKKLWTLQPGDGKKCVNARFFNTKNGYTYTTYACVILDSEAEPPHVSAELPESGRVRIYGTAEPLATIIIVKESIPALLSSLMRQMPLRIQLRSLLIAGLHIQTTPPIARATYYAKANVKGEWGFTFQEPIDFTKYRLTVQVQDLAGNFSEKVPVTVATSKFEQEKIEIGGGAFEIVNEENHQILYTNKPEVTLLIKDTALEYAYFSESPRPLVQKPYQNFFPKTPGFQELLGAEVLPETFRSFALIDKHEFTVARTLTGGDGKKCLLGRLLDVVETPKLKTDFACVILDTTPPSKPTFGTVAIGTVSGTGQLFVHFGGTAEDGATVVFDTIPLSSDNPAAANPDVVISLFTTIAGQKNAQIVKNVFLSSPSDTPADAVLSFLSTPLSLAAIGPGGVNTAKSIGGDWNLRWTLPSDPGVFQVAVVSEDKATNTSQRVPFVVAVQSEPSFCAQQPADPACAPKQEKKSDETLPGQEEPKEQPKTSLLGTQNTAGQNAVGIPTTIENTQETILSESGNEAPETDTSSEELADTQKVKSSATSTVPSAFSNPVTAVLTVAKKGIQKVQKVADDPKVEQAAEFVVAPATVVAGAANVALGFTLPQVLAYIHFLFGQPLVLLRLRKQKSWGVVYNSLSKQPIDLAVVRLLDAKTNAVVQSHVTDTRGRYFFMSEPGEYRLEVTNEAFGGFSKHLAHASEDHAYLDLYHGAAFMVTKENQLVALNVPLDPKGKVIPATQIVREHSMKIVQRVLSMFGIIIAAVALLVSPTPIMAVFLALHLVFFIIFYKFTHIRFGSVFGVVLSSRGKSALHNVVIRIFDAQYDKLIDTHLTDAQGRYAALVGPSVYYATYEKAGYEPKKSPALDYSSEKTKGLGGVVARDEILEPA